MLLVGLGNPVCGDDAVGLRVAERVDALLDERPVPGVRVVTSTRGGFELLDLMAGADAAVVVDCLSVPDARPGAVRHLGLGDLAGCARLVGSHDIGLAEVVALGRLLGVPMPARLEVIAVEARPTGQIEEALSPAVERSVGSLAQTLYERFAQCAAGEHE